MCDNCSMGDKPLLSKLHSAGTWLSWSHCPQPVETSNRDEEPRDRRGKTACSLRLEYFRFLGNSGEEPTQCGSVHPVSSWQLTRKLSLCKS